MCVCVHIANIPNVRTTGPAELFQSGMFCDFRTLQVYDWSDELCVIYKPFRKMGHLGPLGLFAQKSLKNKPQTMEVAS